MIKLLNHKLMIGDRVYVELPISYGKRKLRNYKGVITKQGYRPDQWVIKRDLDGKEQMIHETFVSAIREERAA